MFVLIVSALLGTAFSAVLDPSLTEWRKLETDIEKVIFPLRDYILEIKAFRPDVYNTNPSYRELTAVLKGTTMMMELFSGGWNNQVGRLVWNTISYDTRSPKDIAIEECDVRYEKFYSFPAGGEKEQIWAWNFFQDYVELTCNDELQYEQNFDEGEDHPLKPGLPEKCRALGDADVDRITFKHMKGEYIRGRPKDGGKGPGEPDTKDPEPEDPEDPEDLEPVVEFPTCNCWTPECGYCSNLECTVKHDLFNSEHGISVHSHLKWRKLNSIMFYDEAGNALGNFQWNLKSIHLSGCISCSTPPAVRNIKPGTKANWVFSLKDGVLQIKMGGEVLYENVLKGECAEIYKKVDRFAFFDTTCENTFKYSENEMVAGARITPDCAGTCPQE